MQIIDGLWFLIFRVQAILISSCRGMLFFSSWKTCRARKKISDLKTPKNQKSPFHVIYLFLENKHFFLLPILIIFKSRTNQHLRHVTDRVSHRKTKSMTLVLRLIHSVTRRVKLNNHKILNSNKTTLFFYEVFSILVHFTWLLIAVSTWLSVR